MSTCPGPCAGLVAATVAMLFTGPQTVVEAVPVTVRVSCWPGARSTGPQLMPAELPAHGLVIGGAETTWRLAKTKPSGKVSVRVAPLAVPAPEFVQTIV